MTPEQLAERLIDLTTANGGATIRATGEEVTTGLSVAAHKAYEAQATCLFCPAVKSWIKRMLPMVQENQYYCFGAWRDEEAGLYYLDVVDVLPDRQLKLVLERAKASNQKAIYHLTTNTCLRIE